MAHIKKLLIFLLLTFQFLATDMAGATEPPKYQNHDAIRQAATSFLKMQASGQSGQVTIHVGQVDNRLNLPQCANLTPFLLPGSKPWGKITLGVRCVAPGPWTIYLQANVQVVADYYVAASPLVRGQTLTIAEMSKVTGDLSGLPAGVITDPQQALGKIMQISVRSGSILRTEILSSPPVVQQGQSVRVVSSGPGFQVTADGLALNNAADGQIARVKIGSGQTISGIAKEGGVIEISY